MNSFKKIKDKKKAKSKLHLSKTELKENRKKQFNVFDQCSLNTSDKSITPPSFLNKKRKLNSFENKTIYQMPFHSSINSNLASYSSNKRKQEAIETQSFIYHSRPCNDEKKQFMIKHFPESFSQKAHFQYLDNNINTQNSLQSFPEAKKYNFNYSLINKKEKLPRLPKLKWSPLPNVDYSKIAQKVNEQSTKKYSFTYTEDIILEQLMLNYYDEEKCVWSIEKYLKDEPKS